MGWTTGQTTAQMITVLKTAGALQDQAQSALHSLAHKPNKAAILWGTLVQCTSGWNSGDPAFEYEAGAISYTATNQTTAQVVTALVAAGATTDQATQAAHSLAWQPNKPTILWGVLVTCTTGWNGGDARFSYMTNPS